MLKRLMVAASLVGAVPCASASTLWVGNVFVTAAAPACGDVAAVGDYASLVYRPAGASLGNSADSYLSYVGTRAAFAMTIPNGQFRAGVNYGGEYVSSKLKFGSNAGGVTVWAQTPSTVSTAVPTVELKATLANFYGVVGCVVSLQASLIRDP